MRVKACWTTKYSWMQGEESDLEACGTTKDSWMQVLPRGGRCVDQGSREYLDLIDFVLMSSQGRVMEQDDQRRSERKFYTGSNLIQSLTNS